ncbi:MAG: aminotransferase class IV [Phycisphaerae bacterium]
MADGFVYLNGNILPASEARISIFDPGFTHAAGLFETLRIYGGRPMRPRQHLQRLADSAAVLGMAIRPDVPDILTGIDRVLRANRLADARVRIVLTPGRLDRPGLAEDGPATPTLLIVAGPVQTYPEQLYEQGMRVCISPYKQNPLDPLAGHKTLAYLPRLMAIKDAADRGCAEALWFTTDNRLAEASTRNVFLVVDGTLATPPIETPILPGTVRSAVIELAEANGLPVEQRAIDIDALLGAREVFLTGSVLEIMPVTSIEKHRVGEGVPGDITKRLRRLYAELVAKECELGG